MTQHIFVSRIPLCKKIKVRLLHVDLPFRNIFKKHLAERRQGAEYLQIFPDSVQIVAAHRQTVNLIRQFPGLFLQRLQQLLIRRKFKNFPDSF